MTIDFTKLEGLDEEAQKAMDVLVSNEAFTGYVAQTVENRENAIRESADALIKEAKDKTDEFRTTNIDLKKKLDAKEAIDPEEYGRLKALDSDTASTAEKIKNVEIEFQAKLDGANRKIADYESELSELNVSREKDLMRFNVINAISDWNINNPQLAVENGADKVIVDTALANYKILDGKTVMQKDGKDFLTENGFGTIKEWIGDVAKTQMPFCFKQIQGSGASGSSGGGVTKSFKESNESERVAYVKEHGIDEYNTWKNKG